MAAGGRRRPSPGQPRLEPEPRTDATVDCADPAVAAPGDVRRRRVTGTISTNGRPWQDGRVELCVLDGVRLHSHEAPRLQVVGSYLGRCDLVGCTMPGLDLTGSVLDHVTFRGCDLTGLVVTGARMLAARFIDCRLDDVVGAAGLAGAQVDAAALPSLAPALAAAVGVQLLQPGEPDDE